ncbi:MAG: lysophospholipid acyltransferase family protein [Bryobacteraceae bacterium]|nr:lysophospholipid acyltransferase family protein [Bryobacteraceae bacterium]
MLYLYPVRALARWLPLGWIYTVGRLAEPAFQFVMRRARRKAAERLVKLIDLPSAEAAPVARRFVSNALRRSLDDLTLERLAAGGKIRAEIHGLDHLQRALDAGKGALLVGAHFYGYRLAKRYLADMGYPMLAVRHAEPPDEMMGRLGARYLKKRYIAFLHDVIEDEVMLQDPELALKLFKRLRSGGLAYVHLDAMFSNVWIELPFLSKPRPIATGAWEIARLSGCAVVPLIGLGDARSLTIYFEPPLELTPAPTREAFAAANLPRALQTVASYVRRYPDQWDSWVRLG